MGSIVLTREALADDPAITHQHNWPLKGTAVSTVVGLSSAIFVYHTGADGFVKDIFECVASVQQMEHLPEGAPSMVPDANGVIVPYYRMSSFETPHLSPVDADDVWAIVQEDTVDLVRNFLLKNQLSTTETVTIDEDEIL